MSNKDMFAIAKSYSDPVTNGLNQFKDYLSAENSINKIWQDALTFNKNINAINANNALKAYNDQEALRKKQGETNALEHLAANLYDVGTGTYRPAYQAAQNAAKSVYQNSGNPYAIIANYDQMTGKALELANQVAAIDPAAAMKLRNQAWGNIGISASQNPNGTLSITNSQGYTRDFNNPNIGAMYGVSPEKTATTLAGWKRDDDVAFRDQSFNLDKLEAQANWNRINNEASLKLQAQLNQAAAEQKNKLGIEATAQELALRAKYGFGGSRQGSGAGDLEKLLNNVFVETLKIAANSGETPERAFNMALQARNEYAANLNGNALKNNAAQETEALFTAKNNQMNPAKTPANNATGATTQNTTQQPFETSSSLKAWEYAFPFLIQNAGDKARDVTQEWLLGTRFGAYAPLPIAYNLKDEINQLNKARTEMQAKYEQNLKNNPNAPIIAQQKKFIEQIDQRLAKISGMSEREYLKSHSPLQGWYQDFMYGNSDPNNIVK